MTVSQKSKMPAAVQIDWSYGIDIDGEHFREDLLGRSKYAEFLTKYLLAQSLDKPYVVNLNSGWGTGKTYFLKRWKHDLEKHHPVIYIDAWKNDHTDDPFMTVISAIISNLRELTDKPESSTLIKGIESGWSLIKAMGPLIVGAAAKKYLGKDINELASLMEPGSADISQQVGDAAAKMAQFLISSHEQKNESVKALKADILGWIAAVTGQNSGLSGPTFVIIDELDRCRPSYAVEMLETVKHIFDITGIFFVIATDTEQLQHTIKVVYGNDFDAQTYLSRFFDNRFSLREASLKALVESHCDIDILSNAYCDTKGINLWPRSQNHFNNIISVLDAFNLSPRLAIQVVTRVLASILNMKPNSLMDVVYLTILHCLRVSDAHTYNGVVGVASLGDNIKFFKSKSYAHSQLELSVQVDRSSETMNVALSTYFQSIFLYVSNVFEGSDGRKINMLHTKQSDVDADIRQMFSEGRKSLRDESTHIPILQSEFLTERLHRKNKQIYKDLVELSASFD